jgi:hypothetical protein
MSKRLDSRRPYNGIGGGCDENKPDHVGSGDSEIPLANADEINVSDRLSQCQTFSEIASD